jgi:GNAT superfamily N-acetyltransferase
VTSLLIRDAIASDLQTIVDYNGRLAMETEQKQLDLAVLSRGVAQALADPQRLRYWMAVDRDQRVGQAAITREWSDWRCGWIWWFQSVYVAETHRSQGVFRALYVHIRAAAQAEADVIGLRLYVEEANHRAQSTYLAMGMVAGGYHVYEELWRDRFGS